MYSLEQDHDHDDSNFEKRDWFHLLPPHTSSGKLVRSLPVDSVILSVDAEGLLFWSIEICSWHLSKEKIFAPYCDLNMSTSGDTCSVSNNLSKSCLSLILFGICYFVTYLRSCKIVAFLVTLLKLFTM